MKGIDDHPPHEPEEVEAVGSAREGSRFDAERREFLAKAGKWAGGILLTVYLGSLASCGRKIAEPLSRGSVPATAPAATTPPPQQAGLAIATGQSPGELARKAVDALGGMRRFVSPGDMVVIKPNASFVDGLRNATTTNPDVVGQVVAMCREAGASRVIVMDHVLSGAVREGFGSSGIADAVQRNGGQVIAYDGGDKGHGVWTPIPGAKALQGTYIYPEVLNAAVVITVPKAKHHSGARLTAGLKNFIGVTADMGSIHRAGLDQGIADLNTLVKPKLSVIDASVVLMDNGPGGPGRTTSPGQVIASGDVVAADSYACTLLGITADQVPYIGYAGQAGLGNADYTKLEVIKV